MPDRISSMPAAVLTRFPSPLAATMVVFSAGIMKLNVLLVLVLLLGNPAHAVASETILLVGDSLSAAYGIAVDAGWVALLQRRLQSQQYPYRLVNASISGDTTANALARLPAALDRHQPAIVILQLGGNDGLRGFPLQDLKNNLAAMLEQVADRKARSLLLGVHLPPNYGPRYTERFHAVYHELAVETGAALVPSLVDGIGTRSELMQPDGIHPNLAAQPVIAERVWAVLQPLLDETAKSRIDVSRSTAQ
jgi:acyl-CoA thioesterase-1